MIEDFLPQKHRNTENSNGNGETTRDGECWFPKILQFSVFLCFCGIVRYITPDFNARAMPYQSVTLAASGGIATLTVNRPDKLNALNADTMRELGQAINEVRDREDIRGLIVTGAGRAFIAGADISELAKENAISA